MGDVIRDLPIWAATLGALALFMAAGEVGRRVGAALRQAREAVDEKHADLMLGTLLALLGLLLAFTYSFALARLDARKAALLTEANALGTAFLRADLLPEPGRDALRGRLLEYGRTHLAPAGTDTAEEMEEAIRRSELVQGRLWPTLTEALGPRPIGPGEALAIAAVNEVIDAHAGRVAAVRDRLPGEVLLVVMVVAAGAMAASGHGLGLRGQREPMRGVVYAGSLALVLGLIIDFDDPLHGLIRVDVRPLAETVAAMEAALGGG